MTRQLRPGLGSIEISRPITDIDHFLNQARYHGEHIFGLDPSGLVTEMALGEDISEAEQFEPILTINGVGAPRFTVYDPSDVSITLLEEHAQSRTQAWAQLRRAMNRLTENRTTRRGKQKTEVLSLFWDHLKEEGEKLGIDDPVRGPGITLPLECASITLHSDPAIDKSAVELALVPSPGDMVSHLLIGQVGVCYRGLLRAWSPKATIPPMSPSAFNIPFARLPMESTKVEKERIVERLSDLMPLNVIVGGVRRLTRESLEDTEDTEE